MPRFTDEWVVTKSLFEYTTGGSCACCSFPAIFDPDGLKGLINSVSDLETDAAEDELKSAKASPWPDEMRDSIWADRVKVRYKMKKEMKSYKEFWNELAGCDDDADSEEVLIRWFVDELGPEAMRRIFQMPRSEITEIMSNKYGICPAFGTVICTVVEQVANFGITKYETDARGKEETEFEKCLVFSRRGGFMLNLTKNEKGGLVVDEDVLRVFVRSIKSLQGPKLLQRGPSTSNKNKENDEVEEQQQEESKPKGGPSFRSDRRIIRLVIAKYWTDQIISKYRASRKNKETAQENKV